MKIDNSRVFTADIYEVYDCEVVNTFISSDFSFGGMNYKERLKQKNAIVIKCNHMYVPIKYIKGIFDMMDINSHIIRDGGISHPDERFLGTMPSMSPRYKDFVKNINPAFTTKGKTSLKELHQLQEIFNAENDTEVGMNLID